MKDFKTLRQKAGFTQTALSDLLGVTVSTVSRWERGRRRVSAETAVMIDKLTRGKMPKWAIRPDIFEKRRGPK